MSNGFIKNSFLLEENSRVKDLLDFGVICDKFTKKIDSIPGIAIIALVGPFGCGKSTMLYQIISSRSENELWVEFDAWKYPDRRDLWEGFVLDLAKVISPKSFEVTTKKIKGVQNNDKKTLITTISKIPGFAVLEGLNHFFETSPARRVDDIQEILKEQISKLAKNLFIVIEDIDRSGDAGIFFLETLKQFLKTPGLDRKIVVIVPIANNNYQKNIDSYLKSIDYFEFFEHDNIKLTRFVDEVFDQSLFDGQFKREGDNRLIWTGTNRRTQVISFLEVLSHEIPSVSMRLLKLIIRKSDLIYRNQVSDGHEPDFRITLCLEASKYIKIDNSEISYFDDFKKKKAVVRGNIFSSFLMAIFANRETLYETKYVDDREKKQLISPTADFKFIERAGDDKARYPSYIWAYHNWDDNKENYGLASFYCKY